MAAFAYWYARRRAHDRRYSFGTGKVSAPGGFARAVSLAVVAVRVLVESVGRVRAGASSSGGDVTAGGVLQTFARGVPAVGVDLPAAQFGLGWVPGSVTLG